MADEQLKLLSAYTGIASIEDALSVSSPDTMIFVFHKTVDLFCDRIAGLQSQGGPDPTAKQ